VSTWPQTRLRYVADLNPSIRADLLAAQDTEVSFLPMEAIGEDGSINLERTRPVADVRNGYTYFEDGDVTFAKVTPCFENGKGALMRGLDGGAGFGTSELTVLRPKVGTDARYLRYVVQSEKFRQLGVGAMTGAGGLKRVPDEFTRDFATVWPDTSLQHIIANFLDEQTTRIDALIAEKERLLKTLAELRYSIISWAVTRGLRAGRKMARTSTSFIPEVPQGWTIGGLTKFIGPVIDYRGKTPEKVEEGVLLVTARNIRDGFLDYEVSSEYVRPGEYEEIMRRGRPQIGDVLFTTEAPLGQVGNVDRVDIALAQRVVKFRGLEGVLNNYFLKYWLMGDVVQSTLSTLATGSTAEGIKASKLGQIPLAVPPLVEQIEIVQHLDERRAAIDDAAAHVARHIDRLREYRSSLISAAVTGQLDISTFKVAS
jgi:type I restriction enzyme S subunit